MKTKKQRKEYANLKIREDVAKKFKRQARESGEDYSKYMTCIFLSTAMRCEICLMIGSSEVCLLLLSEM